MVSTPNPFRVDTNLYKIFEYMKDGRWHTLGQISGAVYLIDSWNLPLPRTRRRRVASALRTIRHIPKLWVRWNPSGKDYRLEDGRV